MPGKQKHSLSLSFILFTVGLFHAGRNGTQKIVGCEERFDTVALMYANRGKVSEYFVGRRIRANAILVLDNLIYIYIYT